MTKEMAQTQLQTESELDLFVEFLDNNPDIFQRRPELLDRLKLSDQRGTTSLLERQITRLQDRLHSFQAKHYELFDVARENEQINDSFSNVICQLISYRDLSEFASGFPQTLKQTFDIDEVSIKTTFAMSKKPVEAECYNEALRRLAPGKPVCDNRWPSNIVSLFFSDAIKSAALVPLLDSDDGEIIGVMGLGSNDPERYTHQLGTAHLDRLGVMCAICLARLQPML